MCKIAMQWESVLVFWSQTACGLRHVQSVRWNIKRSMGGSGIILAHLGRSASKPVKNGR